MYCGHARLCVCLCVCLSVSLSTAACPHYCTDPDVTWGSGRSCPLVVHYWADLQSVHGLRCYGNITRTLGTSWRPSRVTQCERTATCRVLLVGDRQMTGGVLNITAAAWTAGFEWWRSGDITRMQNVSEYMLILALYLVIIIINVYV